ncbi:MAG: large conductance mechanosensitive channel protein MscL [Acidobacteriota bacterium]|nr:MAG: large conductance mechanosensitive channel protein MscL [Acidobacteriota bacterium]
MINDFKKFIARGNLLDLSIGFIMGAAFTAIVKTLTDGIIMPIVAVLTGGIDFKNKIWDISGTIPANATPEQIQAAVKAGTPVILYGQFINDIITFLIVAVVMFFLARYAINIFKALEAEADPTPQEALLTEIRDILKSK